MDKEYKKVMQILIAIFLFCALAFTVLLTIPETHAEPMITSDYSVTSAYTVSGTGWYCWTPQGPTSIGAKYSTLYLYVPTDLVNDISTVKMVWYTSGYTEVGYTYGTMTQSDNIYVFTPGDLPSYWLSTSVNMSIKITSNTVSSLTESVVETAVNTYAVILRGTAENISRLNVYTMDAQDFIDQGYADGYSVGHSDGYDEGYDFGYSEGYNLGVSGEVDPGTTFNAVIGFIAGIFTLQILPGMTISGIIGIVIGFFFLKWFLQQIRG